MDFVDTTIDAIGFVDLNSLIVIRTRNQLAEVGAHLELGM